MKYVASPKFIHPYLLANGENRPWTKEHPYLEVSHKQPRSRSSFRMYDPLPLFQRVVSLVSRWRTALREANLQKRGSRQQRLHSPFCAAFRPLIPKVHKYWKGVYSPKSRLQDRSCTSTRSGDDGLIQRRLYPYENVRRSSDTVSVHR